MSVSQDNPTDTPTSGVEAEALPQEVVDFVAEHQVMHLPVPERNCPECMRTLVPVGLFASVEGAAVWQMQCPTERTYYGVEVVAS